ncbi:S9 family peptidase [Thalassotalea sp. HSM 43]|uniref:alpha/beta hydrolase family protein n=1 Tax=Thalassotalea sp. HSM 43 TaxID=2552945 RepID=UPI001080AA25|nr:alpha/beta fold hydrolase [Thalassotalea sp. HSM 43]QBY05619.1 S9 family peptidase [Thalassotalea sp. HSM 43]
MKALLTFITCLLLAFQVSAVNLQAKDFFAAPHLLAAKLNPTGDKVALLKQENEQHIVYVLDVNSDQETVFVNLDQYAFEEFNINEFGWVDDAHLAVQFTQKQKGIEQLIDSKRKQRLIIAKLPEDSTQQAKILQVKTKGIMVHLLPKQPGVFLYSKPGINSKVYKVDVNKLDVFGQKKKSKLAKIDGGQFKKRNVVKSIKGFATRWYFDNDGSILSVLHMKMDRQFHLTNVSEDEPQELHQWTPEELNFDNKDNQVLLPIAYAGEGNRFYSIDVNQQNKTSLYVYDFDNNTQETVYQAKAFKIVDVLLTDEHELQAVKVINDGKLTTEYVNNEAIKGSFNLPRKPSLVSSVNSSVDKASQIYYIENHDIPGEFYYLSANAKQPRLIGTMFPNLTNKLSSTMHEATVTVEGLDIPYLLTTPNQNKSTYPLVVMPHGGPISIYDNRYYNPLSQLLAANGYAVLQVNFRGSGGYSEELQEAGIGQWGDLMLEDIYQALQQVTASPHIDANNVCIFGISYGGYAAMMMPTIYPDAFKCSASFAGVSDVNLLLHSTRINDAQQEWLKKYVGDRVLEREKFKRISPVYNIDKLHIPLLIGHGAKDKIVDVEHSHRMKLMLEKHNKEFIWYEDEEATHSFGSAEQSAKYFEALLAFLKQHTKQ